MILINRLKKMIQIERERQNGSHSDLALGRESVFKMIENEMDNYERENNETKQDNMLNENSVV